MLTNGPPGATTNQPSLFDHGETAKETRAAACQAAKSKPSRIEQIAMFIRSRGSEGATRHEVAGHFSWPLSGVCRPCLELLRSGDFVEHGTRLSPYGSPAAVIVAASLVGGADQ